MDYEGFVAQGTMLGSGGVIVFDDAQNLVKQIARAARFFAHESCASARSAAKARRGRRRFSSASWPATARRKTSTPCWKSAENMTGKTICVLSDSCATPVVSGIKKFRGDFEALIKKKKCHLVPAVA